MLFYITLLNLSLQFFPFIRINMCIKIMHLIMLSLYILYNLYIYIYIYNHIKLAIAWMKIIMACRIFHLIYKYIYTVNYMSDPR